MRTILDTNSMSPRDLIIHQLANTLSSDVIGFASMRLSEMTEEQGNEILKENSKEDMLKFLSVFLNDIKDAYDMQVKALSRGKDD